MLQEKEQAELECALAMSTAVDEEVKKLYGDENDMKVSIIYIRGFLNFLIKRK